MSEFSTEIISISQPVKLHLFLEAASRLNLFILFCWNFLPSLSFTAYESNLNKSFVVKIL